VASEDKDVLAVGDIKGRLTYYLNPILNNFTKVNIFHWHSNMVNALTFSNNGDMLLSGGMEGVVVVWYLNGSKKDFCPRIDGEIVEIVSNYNADLVVIKLGNNAMKVLKLSNFECLDEINDVFIDNYQLVNSSTSTTGNYTGLVTGENCLNLLDPSTFLIKKYNLTQRNLT